MNILDYPKQFKEGDLVTFLDRCHIEICSDEFNPDEIEDFENGDIDELESYDPSEWGYWTAIIDRIEGDEAYLINHGYVKHRDEIDPKNIWIAEFNAIPYTVSLYDLRLLIPDKVNEPTLYERALF